MFLPPKLVTIEEVVEKCAFLCFLSPNFLFYFYLISDFRKIYWLHENWFTVFLSPKLVSIEEVVEKCEINLISMFKSSLHGVRIRVGEMKQAGM